MMIKQGIVSLLALFLWLPLQAASANATTEPPKTHTISVVRGQPIKVSDIEAIADISSARDQKGNPVTLEGDTYTIGSFTRTTLTVVPPDGKPEDVITLDLIKQPD